jgi:hypothetical protein
MFTNHRVVFSKFKLVALEFRILGGGVKVAGSGCRLKLDDGSHESVLHPLLPFGQSGFESKLRDRSQAARTYAHAHKAAFRWNPDSLPLQIGLPAPARLVVGVRNVVTAPSAFAGDGTYFCHK